MPITFSADEIFEIAEEMERNGAKFYRKAAKKASDDQTKQLLLNMADMEEGHLKTFQKMREELSDSDKEPTAFDPDNEGVLYLQAVADSRGYEGRKSPDEELSGNETIKEIIEIALNSEKEAVVFYFGLKSLVPPGLGRDKVEAIIVEELSHTTSLLNKLGSM